MVKTNQPAETMKPVAAENHSLSVNKQVDIMAAKAEVIILVDKAGLWWLRILGINATTKKIWQMDMTMSCQRIRPKCTIKPVTT